MRWLAASLVIARVANAEPRDVVSEPVTLARGEVAGELVLETSLKARSVGTPLSLAPDAWVGVTARLTVGVIHSNRSVDQIDTGDSFCLRGNDLACDRTYQGSGLDARYLVRDGLAPRARLLLRDVDPSKPAVTLGALARWSRGRFAITSDPYVRLGLANRDRGNRAAVVLPLWFAVQPTCRWALALHAGYDSELAVVKDGWHLPVGIATIVRPYRGLAVGAEFGFPSLLGPQNQFAERALQVTVGWRQPALW